MQNPPPSSMVSLLRSERAKNWKERAALVDQVLNSMLASRALAEDGTVRAKRSDGVAHADGGPVLFIEGYELNEASIENIRRLADVKKRDINNKAWLFAFQTTARELLEHENDKDIAALFSDRYCFDVFGVEVSMWDLAAYKCLTDEELSAVRIYNIPKIRHIRDELVQLCESLWSAFFFAVSLTYSKPDKFRPRAALFRVDPEGEELKIADGQPVWYRFSHTKHLLQHVSAFVDRGFVGLLCPNNTETVYAVENPTGKIRILDKFELDELEERYSVEVYCSNYPVDFLRTPSKSFNILVQPAVHWVENPELYPSNFCTVVQAIAPIIDGVVSQNSYMLELTRGLLCLGGSRLAPDRYLEVPVSIWPHEEYPEDARQSVRDRYGYSDDMKVIVNGGGAWNWTATQQFVEEFCKYCSANPDTKIRFVQMGLRQKGNMDHTATVMGIRALQEQYARLFKDKYLVIEEWDDASALLPRALLGFDYGFSVSKMAIEAVQAHRVRLTEYMQFALPAIINDFDCLRPLLGDGAIAIDVRLGFGKAFRIIEEETEDEYRKRVAAIEAAVPKLNERGDSTKIVDLVERCYGERNHELVARVRHNVEQLLRFLIADNVYDVGRPVVVGAAQPARDPRHFIGGAKDIARGMMRVGYSLLPPSVREPVRRRAASFYGRLLN